MHYISSKLHYFHIFVILERESNEKVDDEVYRELKENRPHGTKQYPYTQYFINSPRRAFHIPVHWHEEVEIIYIKKGSITISIGGESFTANEGDLFFVKMGELHFMESNDMNVEYYTLLFPWAFLSFQIDDAHPAAAIIAWSEAF